MRSLICAGVLLGSGAPLEGQASPCATGAPWMPSSALYTAVSFVGQSRGRIVILGSPSYAFVERMGARDSLVDAGFVGLSIDRGIGVRKVPMPPSASVFDSPLAWVRADGVVEALWGESDTVARVKGPEVRQRVMTGRLTAGRWEGVRELAEFEEASPFQRHYVSDPLEFEGSRIFLMPVALEVPWRTRLAVFTQRDEQWSVEYVDLRMPTIESVEAEIVNGNLYVIFTGIPLERLQRPGFYRPTVWLMRREAGAWTLPEEIGGDPADGARESRLVSDGRVPLAVWIGGREQNTLFWRRLDRSGEHGAINQLDGFWTLTQGLRPHRDMLSALRSTGNRALVFRASSGRLAEIASVPTIATVAPTIASIRGRVTAFSVMRDSSAVRRRFHLVGHDLSCALQRAPARSRR